jgi:hypothetical protein
MTFDAQARALRLSKTQHRHLKALARGGDRRAFTPEIVPPSIRRMIESLNQPACATGQQIGEAAGICPAASALNVVCGAAPRLEIDANGNVTAL